MGLNAKISSCKDILGGLQTPWPQFLMTLSSCVPLHPQHREEDENHTRSVGGNRAYQHLKLRVLFIRHPNMTEYTIRKKYFIKSRVDKKQKIHSNDFFHNE